MARQMELASQANEGDGESFVDAEMERARAVRDSERCYRAMFYGHASS